MIAPGGVYGANGYLRGVALAMRVCLKQSEPGVNWRSFVLLMRENAAVTQDHLSTPGLGSMSLSDSVGSGMTQRPKLCLRACDFGAAR
jgi:hypothetical protein